MLAECSAVRPNNGGWTAPLPAAAALSMVIRVPGLLGLRAGLRPLLGARSTFAPHVF